MQTLPNTATKPTQTIQTTQTKTQTPPPPPPSFFAAHKTAVILSSLACLLILIMTLYLISPFKNTLFSPANNNNFLIPTTTTSPRKNTSAVSQPTTNPQLTSWKTYTNTTYKYSIKYPPDWMARDLGALEPKIPSYIAFNAKTASASARHITISITTRTYQEQLALGASSSAITVGGISGTKQTFKDSDGNTSTVVVLPRTNNLLVLRAKTAYLTTFNLMLSALNITK